tara:strand:- start:174 stop:368 length:195 start_codon:yes stop_codon:yes gene_type:complete
VIPGFSLADMLNPEREEPDKKSIKAALDKRMFPFRKSKFEKTESGLKEAALKRALDSMNYQNNG